MAKQTKRRSASRKQPPQRGFVRHRVFDAMGVSCAVLAIMLTMALLSYDPADPSFNKTGDDAIQNAVGVVGAYVSDLIIQIVGLASALMVLCLGCWSWRCFSKRGVRGWWLRISSLLLSMATLASVLSIITPWTSWPTLSGLGGSMGMLIHANVAAAVSTYGAIVAMLGIFALSFPLALGLKLSEWMSIAMALRWVGVQQVRAAKWCASLLKGYTDIQDDDEVQSRPARKTPRIRIKEDEVPQAKLSLKRVGAKKHIETLEEEDFQPSFNLKANQGDFEMPSTHLLNKVPAKSKKRKVNESSLSQNAELLEQTLLDFGIKGEITRVRPGPVVTLYELEPAAGVKSSRVIGLSDDIARSMSAASARISVIPGKNALGIELPNASRETVFIREMFEHGDYVGTTSKLPLVLGKDIGGEPVIADLARMPHLLVAGTTGSGKSVAINTMITSLIYHLSPEECKFIMIDPKMLELSVYDDIPHLLSPVVTEPGKAVVALKWTVKEMENRYRLMSNLGVRNVENYNKRIREAAEQGEELFRTVQTGFDPETGKPVMEKVAIDMNPLPYIVVVVDEMADLMLVAGKDIESSIQRLAQMARAAGIHIIMATQRPSVDVITGVIKANFPTRISFQVTSKIDSRTILGEQGAEQLLGQGDMLYMAGGGRIQRVHGPFISDKEVEQIVNHLKEQGEPEYVEDVTVEDEESMEFGAGMEDASDGDKALYDQAVGIVMRDQKASTSYIQRKLKIGYNRAARIIEQMEEDGIVGAANHVGKREVLLRQTG